MLVLHKFVSAWDVADISPFCIKVETYLRFIDVKFELRTTNNRRSQTSKLPVLQIDDEYVSDSNQIIARLERQSQSSLDASLNESQRITGRLLRSAIEQDFYFLMMWHYYQDEQGFEIYWPELKRYCCEIGVRPWLLPFVKKAVRRKFLKVLHAQGTGRKNREEVEEEACEILSLIASILANKSFIHGEKPTTIDATVYGFLSRVLFSPFEGKVKDHLQKQDNLVNYCKRIQTNYY
ncbi:glutathione S-transferase family protein [Vibrio sonorensis]|uniref:glutathione S-transferase family protein n=1 Tax=Vibrio sonorensis TaxID=1004316 RepID=UPI0008D9ABC0|nr:glutathione S-transferase family protein [Vibrio sonorensis]